MPLSELKQILVYDPETGAFRWRHRTARRRSDLRATSLNGRGYLHVLIHGKCWLAHQLAWFFVHGVMPQEDIDHINGVRTDNRIVNLREATRSQNCANQMSRPRRVAPLKGVGLTNGRWTARIKYQQKIIHIGCFDTPEDAHAAYKAKAISLFGEFARLS